MFDIIDTAIKLTVFVTVIYITTNVSNYAWLFIKKESNTNLNKFIKINDIILKTLLILLFVTFGIQAIYFLTKSLTHINFDFPGILQIIICFIVYNFIKIINNKILDNMYRKEFLSKRNPENRFGAVFAYMDMMNIHLKSNKNIADKIMASSKNFEKISEVSLININKGINVINDYFTLQNEKLKILCKKQDYLINSFDEIIIRNIKAKETIIEIQNKMDFSLKALNYFKESDRILSEMLDLTREDFNLKAKLNNEVFEKQVNLILEKINNITFSYSDKNFIDIFTTSYNSTVSNYWQRINTAITHYENITDKKIRLLTEACSEMSGFINKESEHFIRLHKSCNDYLEKNKKIISIMLNTYKNDNLKPAKLKVALSKLQ